MENLEIYQNISTRTQGDIYVGVVGPVRTGKSTFIKRFMELLVLPNIDNLYQKERAVDELPQSAGGRTIMTTEPKFVPNEAIEIVIGDNLKLKTRLVDCVGYLVDNAIGHLEDDLPRMVKTPWSDKEMPFELAAEMGTKKVIEEHSTIGIVVTTDGSITDITRADYIEPEERVINELKALNKPFIVVLNSSTPRAEYVTELAKKLEEKYGVTVLPANCENMSLDDMNAIFSKILYEFNDTCESYPRNMMIHQLFEEQVARTPDNTALVFEDKQMSYRELNSKANHIARVLRNKGVKADSIVGIMVERSFEMIVGILGILKAGGAYLPIDPEYPEERIRFMLDDSEVSTLLTQSWLRGKTGFSETVIELDDNTLYDSVDANLEIINCANNLAYVIYTSGSTGKPKGVMVEHVSMVNFCIGQKNRLKLI